MASSLYGCHQGFVITRYDENIPLKTKSGFAKYMAQTFALEGRDQTLGCWYFDTLISQMPQARRNPENLLTVSDKKRVSTMGSASYFEPVSITIPETETGNSSVFSGSSRFKVYIDFAGNASDLPVSEGCVEFEGAISSLELGLLGDGECPPSSRGRDPLQVRSLRGSIGREMLELLGQ